MLADLEIDVRERVVIARLTGEVDLSNVDQLRAAITEATPNHALALILDLSGVDYLDSSGIQLIYRLREDLRSRGQVLRLVIPSHSPAHSALRIAGVANHVETVESVEEGLSGLDDAG